MYVLTPNYVNTHMHIEYESFTQKHIGEQVYTCGISEKIFSHTSNLIGHAKRRTCKQLYNCDICERTFAQMQCHAMAHTVKNLLDVMYVIPRYTERSFSQ
jgi:hypothetical protein